MLKTKQVNTDKLREEFNQFPISFSNEGRRIWSFIDKAIQDAYKKGYKAGEAIENVEVESYNKGYQKGRKEEYYEENV